MNENLDHFEEISKDIHPRAEEVTIVGERVEENLFDSKNAPTETLIRFLREMVDRFDIRVDTHKLQQFSYQPADGVTYHEPKFMAVYSGGERDCREMTDNVLTPHDDYCINYFLDSKQIIPKFYDLDIYRHQFPDMPEGGEIINHWGLGVSTDPTRKDLYFLHPDVSLVAKFYDMPAPGISRIEEFVTDTTFSKVFGLTYDATTLEPLKLKLYYYPGDPHMEFTVFDEVDNDKGSRLSCSNS